jgi:hypothetical protein
MLEITDNLNSSFTEVPVSPITSIYSSDSEPNLTDLLSDPIMPFYSEYDIDVTELTDQSPTMLQPKEVKVKLKPHQLTLLHKCIELENSKIHLRDYPHIMEKYPGIQENDNIKTNMGIIGDKAGAGKSYVILSLIMCNKNINYYQIKSFGYDKVFMNISSPMACYKTNILVIPHNLYYQWEVYIKNIAEPNTFSYKMISRNNDLIEFINDAKRIGNYDIIVITDSYYRPMANIINMNDIKINRLIFDEIDSLRLPQNKNISCKFLWLLTASYSNLLYPKGYTQRDEHLGQVRRTNGLINKGYIKDLFINIYYQMDKQLAHLLVLKNADEYVNISFDIPEPVQMVIECREPLYTKLLNGIVDRDIIKCLNADNYQGAIDAFCHHQKKTQDNIIDIIISSYTTEIHNIQVQIDSIRQMVFYTYDVELNRIEQNNKINKLNLQIIDIERKITNIKDRVQKNDLCNICFDDTISNKTKTVVKCCTNVFCFCCINIWLSKNKECPLCKTELNQKDLFLIQKQEQIDKFNEQNKASIISDNINEIVTSKEFDKLKNLEILLRNKPATDKLLIFSEYDISFDHISKILERLNISYSHLKGNKYQIQKTINDYKLGHIQVLLINFYNYGSGLNLECTDGIIIFHSFATEMMKQVVGRAQRIGRTQPLKINYLLNENEIFSM